MSNKLPLPFADKKLGQHFLKSEKIIQAITEQRPDHAQAILEVGPGPAIITQHLIKHRLPTYVIEKDPRMKDHLTQYLEEDHIAFADALEFDFRNFIKYDTWLVSNLPYNVSAPLTVRFLKFPLFKWMTLMYQAEAADKIFPFQTKPEKAMNSLLALCQNYFEIKMVCKVPPGAFAPPPKVDSAVLQFSRRENPIIPLQEVGRYEQFLRHLFQFKRKQIPKNLKSQFSSEEIDTALEKIGIAKTARAESFTLEQVQNLYRELYGH